MEEATDANRKFEPSKPQLDAIDQLITDMDLTKADKCDCVTSLSGSYEYVFAIHVSRFVFFSGMKMAMNARPLNQNSLSTLSYNDSIRHEAIYMPQTTTTTTTTTFYVVVLCSSFFLVSVPSPVAS